MSGSVALVTGAARGIGAATVAALVAQGWSVVAVDVAADDPALPYPMATRAQLDALYAADPEFGTSGSTTGDPLDLNPADLFLEVSDLGPVCTSAHTLLSCGGHWALTIALPPESQAVGVYDLEDLWYSSMSETTELNSARPDDCGWGGGTIGSGTIEVLAIDESEVRFRVDMHDSLWTGNPNGEYTAIRCR